MGFKEIIQRGESNMPLLETKMENICSFLIQRIYLQHARFYQFWHFHGRLLLRPCSGAVFSPFRLSLWFFFSPSSCSLTMPYLCKYFGLCCLKRGAILGRHQNHGLTFFFNFSCAKQYITSVQILQGLSPQMQYFGFISFLFKTICIKLEACVWAWVSVW